MVNDVLLIDWNKQFTVYGVVGHSKKNSEMFPLQCVRFNFFQISLAAPLIDIQRFYEGRIAIHCCDITKPLNML